MIATERRPLFGLGDQRPLSGFWTSERPASAFPPLADNAAAVEAAAAVREWLHAYQRGEVSEHDFNTAISGQSIAYFYALNGSGDPDWPALCELSDHRLGALGWQPTGRGTWRKPEVVDAAQYAAAGAATWRKHRAAGRPLPQRVYPSRGAGSDPWAG